MTETSFGVSVSGFLPDPVRALVLTGGMHHDSERRQAALLDDLGAAGVVSVVADDPAVLATLDHDLLVVNALWWTMSADRYEPMRGEWARTLGPDARAALRSHVDAGRPILALHAAVICFDDWPAWGELLGGSWNWDRSSHPPLSTDPVRVTVDPTHALAAGSGDFDVVDEVYGFLDHSPDIVVAARSAHGGVSHPVAWTRTLGSGTLIAVDVLGHDHRSWSVPAHRRLLRNAIAWLLEGLGADG